MSLSGAKIQITGVVQGVGFRPFVFNLARRLHLNGWVRNTSAGVEIEVEGPPESLEAFVSGLQGEAPPLARIEILQVISVPPNGYASFEILKSVPVPGAFQPISPDIAVCDDCLREMRDPNDRRYHYPFINCTNCGPRFTIIRDIPYDRPKTTMERFPLCENCSQEYHDPVDRRFHAQPVACPSCGPKVWLERENEIVLAEEDALIATQALLSDGNIVAIKGLGGFHLACDATNPKAVVELRRRKMRLFKPLALMLPDLHTVEEHCYLSSQDRELLQSRERPIVLLYRKPGSSITTEVAPNQNTLGIMLPYTPLHYLLFEKLGDIDPPQALVMTSGNLSEEPIATENTEAKTRLGALADAFLLHDRGIHTRCDDSIVRASPIKEAESAPISIRRSRGYAPYPVRLPWDTPPLLAVGAELKNVFCLTRDCYAFLSHHIGDMENFETLASFECGIEHLERLFRIEPEALACDLHPNYMATRYAIERGQRESLPLIGVQHHHAHVAACMVDNNISEERQVIGVAFDGTGYGEDEAIWGGEFLVAGYRSYERAAHLRYIPLPGGDASTRKPARVALAHISAAGLAWSERLPPVSFLSDLEKKVLSAQIKGHLRTPPTSSMGRLFDAVASVLGVRQEVYYEAQAAIELEALADPSEEASYPMGILEDSRSPMQIDPSPMWCALLEDYYNGLPAPIIAARFHNTIAKVTLDVCRKLRANYDLNDVALSGGVWQNMRLFKTAFDLLSRDGFRVYTHKTTPANDAGIALGQAAVASRSYVFAKEP